MQHQTLTLADEAATLALGTALAEAIKSRFMTTGEAPALYFSGDLGAGKTTLVRALLRAIGITGRIKSPTFALMEPYEVVLLNAQHQPNPQKEIAIELESAQNLSLYSHLRCYHFDFYRFTDTREWLEAGFREYFEPQALCLVEWPEKAGPALPAADLHIHLSMPLEEGREARLDAWSTRGLDCLNLSMRNTRDATFSGKA